MPDNITAPAAGLSFATDEIGGVHYPRTKLSIGADGAAADVSTSNRLPVALPDGFATAAKQDDLIAAIEAISPGGGSGGDASAANQVTGNNLLTSIAASLDSAVYFPATQPVSGTVSISGTVPVSGTFWQATQPVSIAGTVAVSGPLTDAQLRATPVPVSGSVGITGSVAVTGTFWQATQPISAAALPLPSGAATAANQTAEITALATIGTRAYGAGQQVAVGATSAASSGLAATEVLLHASTRCFVRVATAATAAAGIPLEAGEKFHLRLNSGQQIHVIRDTADGLLNIVPVA